MILSSRRSSPTKVQIKLCSEERVVAHLLLYGPVRLAICAFETVGRAVCRGCKVLKRFGGRRLDRLAPLLPVGRTDLTVLVL